VRRALVLAAVVGACAVAAAPAGATNECRGLMICVPVAGPWVVATPGQVEFQLSCPARYVVAGLDAELSARGIDVGFVGAMGSPVNPGITTSRDVVFLGRVVRDAAGATFRPHIGCIPASGGGRRTPTAYVPTAKKVFPPQKSTERVIVNFVARTGTTVRRARCPRNELLVKASHAVGFLGETPPAIGRVGAVRVSQRFRNGVVTATVRAPRGAGAMVQLDLLCAAQ
jgi:hypothetical protein